MNETNLFPSFEDLFNAVRWHGYACVSTPDFVAPDAPTWGWGESTYKAMVSACGTRLADLVCEMLNNGGSMSDWRTHTFEDQTLLVADVENADGQIVVTFYM